MTTYMFFCVSNANRWTKFHTRNHKAHGKQRKCHEQFILWRNVMPHSITYIHLCVQDNHPRCQREENKWPTHTEQNCQVDSTQARTNSFSPVPAVRHSTCVRIHFACMVEIWCVIVESVAYTHQICIYMLWDCDWWHEQWAKKTNLDRGTQFSDECSHGVHMFGLGAHDALHMFML